VITRVQELLPFASVELPYSNPTYEEQHNRSCSCGSCVDSFQSVIRDSTATVDILKT